MPVSGHAMRYGHIFVAVLDVFILLSPYFFLAISSICLINLSCLFLLINKLLVLTSVLVLNSEVCKMSVLLFLFLNSKCAKC